MFNISLPYLIRSRFAGFVMLAGMLAWSGGANAAVFNFSFENEDGMLAGIVSGTIIVPDGDGVFAATSVVVDAVPDASLNFWLGVELAPSAVQNMFAIVGGAIDASGSGFVGVFNPITALGIGTGLIDGGNLSFVDTLNGQDLGLSGVQDADGSTLSFVDISANAVASPSSLALMALSVFGVGALARRRQAASLANA